MFQGLGTHVLLRCVSEVKLMKVQRNFKHSVIV